MPELPYAADEYINLSAAGTANCYIVSSDEDGQKYCFDATVIGNGLAGFLPDIADWKKYFHKPSSAENATIAPGSAKLLWQDGTELITVDLSILGGKVHFTSSGSRGNAVIAVYESLDGSGDILWSWHIWCTDQPDDQAYINKEGSHYTFMDRNLGATSNSSAGGESSYGLHYQWGRKDPFRRIPMSLGAANRTPAAISVDIAYSIAHPNVFITSSDGDWLYLDKTYYLWGNPEGYKTPYTAAKSIYDPCPPGYMVAPFDTWTNFSTSSTWDDTNKGHIFNTNSGGTTWYPAAGFRGYDDGILTYSGSKGGYWSSSPYSSVSSYAGSLYFSSDFVTPLSNYGRAGGFSVRCCLQ